VTKQTSKVGLHELTALVPTALRQVPRAVGRGLWAHRRWLHRRWAQLLRPGHSAGRDLGCLAVMTCSEVVVAVVNSQASRSILAGRDGSGIAKKGARRRHSRRNGLVHCPAGGRSAPIGRSRRSTISGGVRRATPRKYAYSKDFDKLLLHP